MHMHTVLAIALLSGLLDERTVLYIVKLSRKSFFLFLRFNEKGTH